MLEIHSRRLLILGPEYFDRSEIILKETKFDFLVAKSLYGQRVTMGDIVAHSISVSSLEQIVSAYEKLLPGYRNALPAVCTRWIEDRDLSEQEPIIKDVERVLATIQRSFEVRHIVTHEVPLEKPYTVEEISEYLTQSRSFLEATDWYIISQLKGYVPRTQTTMNSLSHEALKTQQNEMQVVLGEIAEQGRTNRKLLEVSQQAWGNYAKAESDLRASIVSGGSMYPMVWGQEMAELTRDRTKSLQLWLEKLRSF
jgi:uncharacterized protein YecT (DUF1311 family)